MMRRFTLLAVAAALAGASAVGFTTGAVSAATPTTLVNFAFTGADGSFVVPAGVTQITIDGFGAQGGDGGTCGPAKAASAASGHGGLGADGTSTIAVTPGETLTVVVGGQGGDGTCVALGEGCTPFPGTGGAGGFGGGGLGGNGGCPAGAGGGGGGATMILRGTTPLFVVAGGGGGSGRATRWSRLRVERRQQRYDGAGSDSQLSCPGEAGGRARPASAATVVRAVPVAPRRSRSTRRALGSLHHPGHV